MNDFILNRNYSIGDRGGKVKLIQEWLCLHGFLVTIDDDFGPATDRAIRRFQTAQGLEVDGVVGNNTFTHLIRPAVRAMSPISITSGVTSLGSLIVAYAQLHLEQHSREVGGQNRGPWVRMYMDGNEGSAWAWCAGFAMFVVKQACRSLGMPYPINGSFSCDELARQAQTARLFVPGLEREKITSGALFLIRKTDADWTHTGIVTHVEADSFDTIEGNTNDTGSREGYEVCARTRGFAEKDFIVWR